jgi:hypothetical protein
MLTLRKPLVAVLALFSISPALAIEPDDLLVGPISYQQDASGVSVTLIARTYFKVQTIDNKRQRSHQDIPLLQSRAREGAGEFA